MNGGGSDWASILLVIIILTSFLLNFTDLPQKMQLWRWASFIRKRLYILERLELESKERAAKYFNSRFRIEDPRKVIDNFMNNYFLIRPVDIEPTDIIKRLKHLLRVRDKAVKLYVDSILKDVDESLKRNAEVVLEVVSAISQVNKIIKHYFQLGLKFSNWVLVMQLALEMPLILRMVQAYHESLEAFTKGLPIGDGAGALVARAFIKSDVKPEVITEDTELYRVEYKGRNLFIIKAKGPGATVGWPGDAVEKVVEMLGGKVSRIITIDAALKLESESTGEVAYGVGAAIGDPGPEKIAIERVATKYSIPLEAVVIKMSEAEAINAMTKDVYEGVRKAIDIVRKIIEEKVGIGENVIIVGIGNTVGIR